MTQVFILSLPRSGSTLLQRILATSPTVETCAEPWLLLGLIGSTINGFTASIANSGSTLNGMRLFSDQLPNGIVDLRKCFVRGVQEAYQMVGGDSCFFIDKTPRYSLIAQELVEVFPEAKFIILFRHPLSVIASVVETFASGHWNLPFYYADFYHGLPQLINISKQHRPNVSVVQYEDLVGDSEATLKKLASFIGLEPSSICVAKMGQVGNNWGMGDRVGLRRYGNELSNASVNRWQATISNGFRARWCQQYLRWLGENRMTAMGYDYDKAVLQLRTIRLFDRKLLSDLARNSWYRYAITTGLVTAMMRIGRRFRGSHELHPQ